MGAFHAYDIRGIYNVDFDKEVAYKVGYFLPELLSADKVLVGRDGRVSSDEIHEYLLKGITDAGADVYDIGLSIMISAISLALSETTMIIFPCSEP